MRSILCYLLFAIGGTVTYVCAEEKEQIGSDTLENILFVDDFDAKCVVPIQQSGNFVRMPTTPGHSILGVWMVTKM